MFGLQPDAGNRDATLDHDRPCLSCGYNLRGLPTSGSCPECGTPVERSLRGNLLLYSSPDYVASLHRGVFLIQAGIITTILSSVTIVGLYFAIDQGLTVIDVSDMNLIGMVFTIATGAASVIGWWLLSTPDAAVLGSATGQRPRRIVRIAVIASTAAAVLEHILSLAGFAAVQWFSPTGHPLELLMMGATLAPWIAYIVWFFAAMHYILWLAPRLPSAKAISSARTLEWVGPVISVFLCVLGWLIALVMYYNLLDEVRLNLRRIRREQAKAAAA